MRNVHSVLLEVIDYQNLGSEVRNQRSTSKLQTGNYEVSSCEYFVLFQYISVVQTFGRVLATMEERNFVAPGPSSTNFPKGVRSATPTLFRMRSTSLPTAS